MLSFGCFTGFAIFFLQLSLGLGIFVLQVLQVRSLVQVKVSYFYTFYRFVQQFWLGSGFFYTFYRFVKQFRFGLGCFTGFTGSLGSLGQVQVVCRFIQLFGQVQNPFTGFRCSFCGLVRFRFFSGSFFTLGQVQVVLQVLQLRSAIQVRFTGFMDSFGSFGWVQVVLHSRQLELLPGTLQTNNYQPQKNCLANQVPTEINVFKTFS